MTIYYDNLSSIQLAKNPVFHARAKHIEVHYHFVRECVLSGEVKLQYVSTDRQNADIFTKPLGLDKLQQFSGALGLRHLDVLNLRGEMFRKTTEAGEKFQKTATPSRMMNSISDRLKKPRTDPKANIRGAAGRKSRSQPSMGEMKPSRVRRPKTSWRQPTQTRAKTDRRKPSRFGCLIPTH